MLTLRGSDAHMICDRPSVRHKMHGLMPRSPNSDATGQRVGAGAPENDAPIGAEFEHREVRGAMFRRSGARKAVRLRGANTVSVSTEGAKCAVPPEPVSGTQSMFLLRGSQQGPIHKTENQGWRRAGRIPVAPLKRLPGHPARCPVGLFPVPGVRGVPRFGLMELRFLQLDLNDAPPLRWHHSIC